MKSNKTVPALVCGIIGVAGGILPCGIAALVLANIAIKEGDDDKRAKVAKILGIISIVLYVLAFIIGIIYGLVLAILSINGYI